MIPLDCRTTGLRSLLARGLARGAGDLEPGRTLGAVVVVAFGVGIFVLGRCAAGAAESVGCRASDAVLCVLARCDRCAFVIGWVKARCVVGALGVGAVAGT